jgi:hypothetical protein
MPLYINRTAQHYEIAVGIHVKQRNMHILRQRLKQQKRQTRPKKKLPTTIAEETDSEPDADEKESEEEMDAGAAEQVDQSTNK